MNRWIGESFSRRDLLLRVVAAPLGAALFTHVPQAAPGSLRLLVHGRLPDAAGQGLQFGVAEASITASLLGRELQLGTSAAGLAGAIGVIAARPPEPGAIPPRTPVVLLRDVSGFADAACTFRIGLNAAERDGALARWRAATPATPAPDDPQVVEWHPRLFRYGAAELNERYVKEAGGPMTADAWLAWFAVKSLVDSALRHPDTPPCEALAGGRFDGHKGRPLGFDAATRTLRQPVYVVSGDQVLGEIL